MNGVTPKEASCSKGLVFNENTERCDDPENVPGCETKKIAKPLRSSPKGSRIRNSNRGNGGGNVNDNVNDSSSQVESKGAIMYI